jgi:biotin carboxyl carrier protein
MTDDIAIKRPETRLADPRGVRVSLAGSAASADLPPLVIEPPQIPVVAPRRIAGRGLLGGTAPIPPAPAPVPTEARHVLIDGEPVAADLVVLDQEHAVLVRDGAGGTRDRVLLLPALPAEGATRGVVRREVVVDGWRVEVEVEAAARAALRERARRGREEASHSGPTEVHAIIPGVVVAVSVAPGDEVVAGQQLLVVEAMKMQNELHAPREGRIERVAVAPGRTIEVGDLLLVID